MVVDKQGGLLLCSRGGTSSYDLAGLDIPVTAHTWQLQARTLQLLYHLLVGVCCYSNRPQATRLGLSCQQLLHLLRYRKEAPARVASIRRYPSDGRALSELLLCALAPSVALTIRLG